MRTISLGISAAMTLLLLAGCIRSDKPLLAASNSAMPLAAGEYRGGETGEVDEMQDVVVVVAKSGEYAITKVVIKKEEGKPDEVTKTLYAVRFHPLDEHHFVAQAREIQKTATPYSYVFVHFENDVVKFYAVRCDWFLKASRIMKAYEFAKSSGSQDWCEAHTFDGLLAFMHELPLQHSELSVLEYAITRRK